MEDLFLNNTVTKSLEPINSDERFFEGYLTVEVKDKQGEITIVDELYKVLPVWMDRGAPISDTHSNRIIGKGINFSKTLYKSADGTQIPAIKITGKIHKNYELDNEIWSKIKSGEYKGLSFGGATKTNRTPKVLKDGSIAYQLTDLEHYEVAVCKDPAVPLALITDYNPIAKANVKGKVEDRNGKMVIRCSKFGCRVNKADLSGIATFEGKVEALMDEGKSRESAEKIVGSFTKKDNDSVFEDPHSDQNQIARIDPDAEDDNEEDERSEFEREGDELAQEEKIPFNYGTPEPSKSKKKDNYAADDERGDEEDEIDVDKILQREGKSKKKDYGTGHDVTQVSQPPDSPREHSDSDGDSSGMYNQNGAEQRVGSNKADYSTAEAKENTKRMYEDAKIKRKKEREEHYKECPTCGRSDADHDEDDDDYINRASPNPISEAGEIKTHPDKKLSNHRRSVLRALKHKAFDLDVQWKIIDMLKGNADRDEEENVTREGEVGREHRSHNTPTEGWPFDLGTEDTDDMREYIDNKDEMTLAEIGEGGEEEKKLEDAINTLKKDAMYRGSHMVGRAKPKVEGQSHGQQSTDARINLDMDDRHLKYEDEYPLRRGRSAAPTGSKKPPTDKERWDEMQEGLDTGNPAIRGNRDNENKKRIPKQGESPKDLKRSAKAIMLQLKAQLLKDGTNAANGTSPRGGDFSGTQDDGKFNVRYNGGRKVNTHGKKAEDLGNFP